MAARWIRYLGLKLFGFGFGFAYHLVGQLSGRMLGESVGEASVESLVDGPLDSQFAGVTIAVEPGDKTERNGEELDGAES